MRHPKEWTFLGLAAFLWLTTPACDEGHPDCLALGTCTCISAAECPEGEHCVDGQCQVVIGPDVGRRLFGEPCLDDGECRSGFCLPGGPGNGRVCTRDCAQDDCPDGWRCKTHVSDAEPAGQALCVQIISDRMCEPCSVSSQCDAIGDRCLDVSGEFVCALDCSRATCPVGTVCTPIDDAGQQVQQCLPVGGTCSCTEATIGLGRGCVRDNEYGVCSGRQVCEDAEPLPDWGACDALVPGPEVCDGLDNDCDGLTDAQDPSVDVIGLPADPAYPACRQGPAGSQCIGRWHCEPDEEGGFGWTCGATDPEDEWCNGRDDNCDGVADEPFIDAQGRYLHPEHCGFCGADCRQIVPQLLTTATGQVADGAVTCALVDGQPQCKPLLCQPGFYPFPEQQPVTCARLVSPACQPCTQNADCRISTDRCLAIGDDPGGFCAQSCEPSSPYAGCSGLTEVRSCCPDHYTCSLVAGERLCLPDAGNCTCNLERVGQTRSCLISGAAGEICQGEQTCLPAGDLFTWAECEQSDVVVEVCDYLDNNCDGEVDEGFIDDQGRYTTDEHCGGCNIDCTARWDREIQHAIGGCVDEGGALSCQIVACTTESPAVSSPCRLDADCPNGFCDATYHHCSNGSGSCPGGNCAGTFQFVNLNGLDADGCECARLSSATTDEPDTAPTYPDPGIPYVDRNCDGIDGTVAGALFVWSNTDQSLGTRAHPFATIGQAIAAWNPAQHTSILVASGSYRENVALANGLRIYGGYSADFTDRDVTLHPSQLIGQEPDHASPNARPGTVYAAGINSPTVLSGFVIQGYGINYDAGPTGAGYSTYAVFLKDCGAALQISNNWILGGFGGDGANGSPGGAGQNGPDGQAGVDSRECANSADCSGQTNPGGSAGQNQGCSSAAGRAGATARQYSADGHQDYSGSGLDGLGGTNSIYGYFTTAPGIYCKYDCQVGGDGATNNGGDARSGNQGPPGAAGSGCAQGVGSASADGWLPAGATAGQNGNPGNGGGGGGAGGAVLNTNSAASCSVGNPWGDLGASGGGGGAGGCGAVGGRAGGGGGGSFGIFLAYTQAPANLPEIFGNHIRRGFGGRGGQGGGGGQGGLGGQGGAGGDAALPAWCAGEGGRGGRGGDGGAGAGGGGGCGGVSFGIAGRHLGQTAYGAANTFSAPGTTASGGPGGAGGPSPAGDANAGGDGTAGTAGDLGIF